MGTMYWVRVGFMLITLAVVISTMRYMQTSKPTTSPIAKFIMGGESDGQKLVLCPTRVTWIETTSGMRVQQDDMRWTRVIADHHDELNTIAVEKWFGRNCSLKALKTTGGEGFTPILKVGYVSGETATLERAPTGEYLWQGEKYISDGLDGALRTLAELPVGTPAGQK